MSVPNRPQRMLASGRKWALITYNVELPVLPADIDTDNELGTGLAGVVFTDGVPKRLLFSKELASYPYIDADAIVLHEIVHLVAWKLGKDYHDGTPWFEHELQESMLPNQSFHFQNGEVHLF